MSRTLHEVADMLDDLASRVRTTADDNGRKDWSVIYNMAGSLSVLDGEGRYVGTIDVRKGIVELVPKAELDDT